MLVNLIHQRQVLVPFLPLDLIDPEVYAHFTHAQKCWAHLLRKAIKLTLQDPKNESYRKLADELLDIFHEANRLLRDQRFSEADERESR